MITELVNINAEVPPERISDTASVFTNNICFYQYLDITLEDPADDFDILPLHAQQWQSIDSIEHNRWNWAVTLKTYR